MPTARHLLIEGLSDAAGFMGGGLLGYGLGQWMGWDLFTQGYGASALLGIASVGLGCGAGLQVARRLRAAWLRRKATSARPHPTES